MLGALHTKRGRVEYRRAMRLPLARPILASVLLLPGCVEPPPTTWATTAAEHRSAIGETFTYRCPSAGEIAAIWGTDVYSDDSSVCGAAVHAGAITLDEGGEVEIEIRAGLEAYEGSIRNGIASGAYGPWANAFAVLGR